jgi:hypothetical protein
MVPLFSLVINCISVDNQCACIEAARSAARTIAARRGANRAAVAVGHIILTIVYYLLVRQQDYVELGTDFYDQRRKDMMIKQSIKRLEALGVKVSIEQPA